MDKFLQAETLIIELLLVVSLVAIAVRRLRIPYTVALVLAGLLITLHQPMQIDLTPELILALFVPPLVFEAAFHVSYTELRRNLASILLLAVPGVILTTLIVGGILSLGTSLSLPLALLFGSLIAATDPISVVSMFRALGVPKRLSLLVEGESLFNDGTAIVVYSIMLTAFLTGQFRMASAAGEFIRVTAGGAVVGLALGWVVSRIIARVDDYLIETTLTTLLAFGAYLIAERLHFSGVLAVVAAGLVNGNIGPQGMSPTSRIVIFNFWEYVAFLANSFVFLLIGLDVNIGALGIAWREILWAVMGVLVARAVVVYGLGWVVNRIAEAPVPIAWQHILNWGGLRGAIGLALALSLPNAIGSERELLKVMAFGVVLFTLLVQAPTMRFLLRWLRIITRSPGQVEYEERHARLVALRASEKHLDNLHRQGLVSTHTVERLEPILEKRHSELSEAVREVLRTEPAVEAEELDTTRRELLRAQRSAYLGLQRDGMISDEVFEKLTAELDATLEGDVLADLPSLEEEEPASAMLDDGNTIEEDL